MTKTLGIGIILNKAKITDLVKFQQTVGGLFSQLQFPDVSDESKDIVFDLFLKDTEQPIKLFLLFTKDTPKKIIDWFQTTGRIEYFMTMEYRTDDSDERIEERFRNWILENADEAKIIRFNDLVPDLKEVIK